tara:strand:+ start:85749 stop:86432 length:684 start_codon:yes stop_codon:yes gene_type:complete
MSDIILQADAIVKSFLNGDTETEVLKGVNLSIPKGRMIALEGASGSGKSTLLNILGLLMRPTSGELTLLGQSLTRLSDAQYSRNRNQHLGFVFQYHNLLPDFTALENVTFPAAAPAGAITRDIRQRGEMLLDRVGLHDRRNFRATRLSGGQKQRVAVARALINNPDLVLADEPTGNLDRENGEQVMQLLREINQQDQATFLISTHDEHIADLCDERIRIDDGRIVSA